jgi:hypothetical protein
MGKQVLRVSIRNSNGHSTVEVGHDLRDPDIQEVD